VWCETVEHGELAGAPVLEVLGRAGVELVLAVRPWDLAGLSRVVGACERANVRLALWPMLADEDGRWPGAENAEAFAELARRTVEAAPAVREIALDFEPPIERARLALTGARGFARAAAAQIAARGARVRAKRTYQGLAALLRARGVEAWAALPAFTGLPPYAPRVTSVHSMLYTSILEGWSRGVFGRRGARALLAAGARVARARFGARAGVSLGVVGTGAFGDEPVYRSPEELSEDVAAARAAGIRDLALFDLGGVLARPPADAWLRALSPACGIQGS
jgi:hypothetical protein